MRKLEGDWHIEYKQSLLNLGTSPALHRTRIEKLALTRMPMTGGVFSKGVGRSGIKRKEETWETVAFRASSYSCAAVRASVRASLYKHLLGGKLGYTSTSH